MDADFKKNNMPWQNDMDADMAGVDSMLDQGKELQVTYRYPSAATNADGQTVFITRTDKLLAVDESSGRIFVDFRGEKPVWIEDNEVIKIEPA